MVINSYYVFEDFTKSSRPNPSPGGWSEGGEFLWKEAQRRVYALTVLPRPSHGRAGHFVVRFLIRLSVCSNPDAPGVCQVTLKEAGTEWCLALSSTVAETGCSSHPLFGKCWLPSVMGTWAMPLKAWCPRLGSSLPGRWQLRVWKLRSPTGP